MVDLTRFPSRRPGPVRPASSTNKYDDFYAQEDSRAAQGAMLDDREPASVLKARQLGRDLGVPAPLVESDWKSFYTQDLQERTAKAVQGDPFLAKFLGNPDNAAASKNDIDRLGRVSKLIADPGDITTPWLESLKRNNLGETALSDTGILPAPSQPLIDSRRPSEQPFEDVASRARGQDTRSDANPLTVARGLLGTAFSTIGRTGVGAVQFGADAIGADVSDYVAGRLFELDTLDAQNDLRFDNSVDRWAYGAGQSLTTMATGLALGPGAVLPYFGAATGLGDYARFRGRGASREASLAGAIGTGGVEMATEMLGLNFLLGRFGKAGAGQLLGGYLLRELPGELTATTLQSGIEAAVPGGPSIEQQRANLPQDLLDTAMTTLFMTGGIGGAHFLASRMQPEARGLHEAAQAMTGAKFLDQLMSEAEGSDMRKLDPESFREFVEQRTEGTPVQNLYVPVEAIREYMQSEGYEPGFLEQYQQQIEEASATQGDVVIPIADAAAKLAGTPAWEALRERVRVQPGGLSVKEATEQHDEIMSTLEARGAEIAQQAADETEAEAPAAEVYNQVKNELLSIGRAPAEAENIAQLYAASREAWGQRLGMSATEYHEANPVRFADAASGATMGGQRTLDQDKPDVLGEAMTKREAQALADHWNSVDPGSTTVEPTRLNTQKRRGARYDVQRRATAKTATTPAEVDDAEQLKQGRQLFQSVEPQDKLQALMDHAPGLDKIIPFLTDDEKAKLRKDTARKITEMVETFPDAEEMASVAFAGRGKRGWYERSAMAILDVFGMNDAPRFAALLAALSPQTSVESNTTNALAMWVNWDEAGRPTDTKAIKKLLGKSVQGKKGEGSILDAWWNNTVRALTADNPGDITLSGPKVNSFMLNLIGVVDEVTNDAWMANYALIDQTTFKGSGGGKTGELGKSPGYIAFSSLVRRTADVLTKRTGQLWTPAEVQETVWSWTKAVTETRAGAGRVTVDQLLDAGGVTHADISSTPDFAMLFQKGIYRKILEAGGYGEEIEQLGLGDRATDGPDGNQSVAEPGEAAGIAAADFRQHLYTAGARIEERVSEQLKGKAGQLRKTRGDKTEAQPDLFANYAMAPLTRLKTPVKVDGIPVDFGPFAPAREAARRFALRYGLPFNPPTDFAPVDVERAERIAQAFEDMQHDPNDPEVKRAYRAMIDETIAQWKMIKETGLQVDFIEGDDPYGNPRNAIIDVVENNHLWVFPTDAGFGGSASADIDISGNPLLEIVPGEKINGKAVRANDLFRIVHDYFGHIKEGVGFRADGEENAWRIHSSMYSPLARRAMTTETRGQNSWVNFGPFGEQNRTANGAETQYAPQKIGLLPEWVSTEGSGQAERQLYQTADVMEERAGWTEERVGALIQDYGYSFNDDSKGFAVMMSPDQFLGLTVSEKGRALIEDRVGTHSEYSGGRLNERTLAASGPIMLAITSLPSRPSQVQIDMGYLEKHGEFLPSNIHGHEGRHRMTMLKRAGVQQVPVVLMVNNGKVQEPIDKIVLSPQRSRSNQMENGDTKAVVHNLIPINWKNRDKLIAMGGSRVVFQDQSKTARGMATFYDDASATITLFEQANLSTLIHETGHVWLEELRRNAEGVDAPQDVKDDWQTVEAWFKQAGVPLDQDGYIPTAAHEMWARGFERYAMEGKAPSALLERAFAQFRAWLLRIYQLVQNLKAPITPEIREVFDRMLATQDAIDLYRKQQHAAGLSDEALDKLEMTEAERTAYKSSVEGARNEAYDTLLFKTMEAIRRRENAKLREQRANVRAEVAANINARPEFIVLHLLRTGRWLGDPDRDPANVKLNTGWLIDTYGEDVLDRLPKGLPIYKGDGADADQIAEMVGMPSGDAVVQSLLLLRQAADALRETGETRSVRDKMVEAETDRIMAERHGDTMTDGTIEEEAIAAINSARQGEIIAGELRQLGKRQDITQRQTPYQFAREWAKRKILAGRVQDVASRQAVQRYTRATAKAARLAEEAILKGDAQEAFRQKQAQLLNHALLAEAKAAADTVDTIVARLQRLAKRAAMKSVDQDYMDRIHMLLEQYDFRARSQKGIDEYDGFVAWVADQRAKGFEVHIPPRLQSRGEHYSRVTVEELSGLNDLVQSLLHLGKTKQKIRDAQGERDFDEFIDDVTSRIEELPQRKLPAKPINEDPRALAGLASELLKVETLVEELDGGVSGPLHSLIVEGSTKAANLRDALRDKVLIPIAKSYKSLTRKQWKRLQEKITIPELTWNTLNEGDPRLGTPVTITRSELLAIFLNTGNISNLEKLSKGERWPVATLQRVFERELIKEDYDLAQTLWNQVGELWPDIVRVERAVSGVVPEQVEPLQIESKFGTYEGGYWPVVYDSARSQRAEDHEGARLDDMFGQKSGVATQKGHTITRTEAVGPFNLSLERVLFDHIEQVITRVAYTEYTRDVLRVIKNRRVKGLIDIRLGSEYRKQIEPWLARQIHEGAVNSKAAKWWQKMLRQARINMTIAAMGFRFSTGVAQTIGLTASAQRIGARWVATGLKDLAKNPRAASRFVDERSPEMAKRMTAVNRDVAEVFAKLRGKHNALTEAQAWAFWHIGMIDRYIVSIPTWLGAHARGMSEGMNDAEASAYADKSVRLSQGAGREKDLSAIQSPNNDAMRFFTMFYTPFNVMFNAQWQGVRGLKRGDPRPAIGVTFWWMLASTLGDALLSGDWPDDDEESWAGWFARNVFFGMFAGVPYLRDAANYGERKIMGEFTTLDTPLARMIEAVEKAAKTGYKAYEGEDVTKPIKTVGDLTSILAGVPLSQAGTTTQFLWDTSTGEADPETISDWYFGITRGKTEGKNE